MIAQMNRQRQQKQGEQGEKQRQAILLVAWVALTALCPSRSQGQMLDKQTQLEAQTFWDNRDWDWYHANIPFFECPNREITTTYYYRWELLTKHLTYGSTHSGYSFTEFIDRPFWSGTYGAISCPSGHQLYEARWLRDPQIARDYARYWFRTPGAQPRRYSCWLADAIWSAHSVHPDKAFIANLLEAMERNYEGWEHERFDPKVGLFWQTGHDDGMEFNINSRQTKDTLRGAPGYRPTLNSYLWADAVAIAKVAELAGDQPSAQTYRAKADALKKNLQTKLWDPNRQFFFHMYKNNEENNSDAIKAGSLTYQTGKYAGDSHGREEIGFVPWQFNLPDPGYESAWRFLMDPGRFYAVFGPTVTERHDPLFLVNKSCCYWSGQSWPYATSQTLKALANLLQNQPQEFVTKADYLRLLEVYAKTHRKDGRPYIAEATNPDTGSWEGYDSYNHSEHYFHSGYIDLIITGLVGIQPGEKDVIAVEPLAPETWDYFALDDVTYHGRRVSVLWDKTGSRYHVGKGLHLLVDGKEVAASQRLDKLSVKLPNIAALADPHKSSANFAVNNDGTYFPRATASYSSENTNPSKAVDGNYWYHISPPNRWTCEGSPSAVDSFAIDFGRPRRIDAVKLYILDDGETIRAPAKIDLDFWDGQAWQPVPNATRSPLQPVGHRANVLRFPELNTTRLRARFTHSVGSKSGLSEFEAWGDASQALEEAPQPSGNLAFNPGDKPFPKASASFTSRFDKVENANNGQTNFQPNPPDRWSTFESPSPSDWLEIDFGGETVVGRVELAIYDDHGGVQAPSDYQIQTPRTGEWIDVENPVKSPQKPSGGQYNEVRFRKVKVRKLRVVFTHKGQSRSGVSEILIWPE